MKRAEDRMSPAEVGALLGVAENTLAQWRSTRRGPAWYNQDEAMAAYDRRNEERRKQGRVM